MPTCKKCGNGFPNLVRIDGIKRNLCNRKFCLSCSPFRRGTVIELLTTRVFYEFCVLCGKKGNHRLCRSCRTKIHRYRFKEAAINLFGGKCLLCGFKGDQAAFDFHHKFGKKFRISNASYRGWEKVKRELKKCILLCSNCHRTKHSSRGSKRLKEEALRNTDVRFD